MWKKVWNFAEKQEMLRAGDRVVAAVSGGADSVCLLMVLAERAEDLEIRAVHVHHGLRGSEADRDAEFVRKLCGEIKVPVKVIYRDVSGYAEERGISLEEAGRILRYESLENEAEKWERETGESERPVWIAVAHHQDDNAETILHHLLRGSGLRGLAGMRAVEGRRVRPLLAVRRKEILEYLRDRGAEWCEDSTNRSDHYTRNRIRNELIPCMTERVNPRAVENVLHAGELFARADRYLEKQASQIWERYGRVIRDEGTGMDAEVFSGQDPIIQSYLVRIMLRQTASGQRDITARHYAQIMELAGKADGSRCDLPGDIQAFRTGSKLGIGRKKLISKEKKEVRPVVLPSPLGRPVRVKNMEFQVFFREKRTEIPKKEYTKWFDYDKIKDTLSIRYRQQGDYLTLPGGGRKMLNRFLIDEKVPRELRDQILILAERDRVLWVVGYRISEYYKITEETRTILQVDFYGGKAYGG